MTKAAGREQVFPIVEAFGYAADADTPESRAARKTQTCPFTRTLCEKMVQYRYGYCSLTYAAADDENQRRTYAVCDHRLDGGPVDTAIVDHFGARAKYVQIIPEVSIAEPRMSFDYSAITLDASGTITDVAVIETQAIDIRGGGVGPAWRAWLDGSSDRWREYYTAEALTKKRKDKVTYGVNMANIYKRLGLQVAVKGTFLKGIKVPLYVVMQHRPFEYLRRRITFQEANGAWDLTFMTFDYTGKKNADGTLEFAHVQTIRSTLADYVAAMTAASMSDRGAFLDRIKRKAGLTD